MKILAFILLAVVVWKVQDWIQLDDDEERVSTAYLIILFSIVALLILL